MKWRTSAGAISKTVGRREAQFGQTTDARAYYRNPEFHKPGCRHAGLPESASFSHVKKRIMSTAGGDLGVCHGPGMVRKEGITTTIMLGRTWHAFPMQCGVLLATKHVL